MVVSAVWPITHEQLMFLSEVSPGLTLSMVTFGFSCGHAEGGTQHVSRTSTRDLQDSEVDEICGLAGYPSERCSDEPAPRCLEIPRWEDLEAALKAATY
ncbi:MAG: hypothetical protein JWR55_246 [Aeromicrobium sp.]|jgi:hypothetical protein|nr:hypothetical protein [Aeromicrobium sp.]